MFIEVELKHESNYLLIGENKELGEQKISIMSIKLRKQIILFARDADDHQSVACNCYNQAICRFTTTPYL